MPGLFMERNTAHQTPLTFVHELCHVVDKTAIHKGYWQFYYSYQFPTMAVFLEERDGIFGKSDDSVPNLPYGYISDYAKSNAQENFAEHCSSFFMAKDAFKKKAEEELAQGHSLLMDKFKFVEKIFAIENVPYQKLDDAFIEGSAP